MAPSDLHIISKKIIKPSSPTPENLKYYKLSFIDQSITQKYAPLTLFYTNTNAATQISTSLLEKSLSNLLTFYYPFAGTLENNLFINCNDKGSLFIESKIESSMSEILEQPDDIAESTLFPCVLPWTDPNEENGLCVVQITHFGCGGKSLSLCITHKLADVKILCNFFLDWAALTRGSGIISPQLNGASLFPPIDDPLTEEYIEVRASTFSSAITTSRMFKFDASNVNRLKNIICSETEVKHPTRTEVVTAFLNVCIGRYQKFPFILYMAISFRNLINPNLENLVGNVISFLYIHISNEEELNLSTLVRKIRNEKMRKIKEFEGMNENEVFGALLEEKNNFPINCDMRYTTSFGVHPFYEVDYGRGRPERVRCGAMPSTNCIILLSSMEEGGVDAIVSLDETVMLKVQNDDEFLGFANLDPSS